MTKARDWKTLTALFAFAFLLAGCPLEGDTGPAGQDGLPGADGASGAPGADGADGADGQIPLGSGDDLPGVVIEITDISGASGADGTFQVGDFVSVTFTIQTAAGANLALSDFSFNEIHAAGPTSNYQRILDRKRDVTDLAVANADGSYTYTFVDPIPATYLAPLNDSPDIVHDPGALVSEMTGMPLVPGTYTVGMALRTTYLIDGESFRDAGNGVGHFLFGGATAIEERGVVVMDNCNECHTSFRIHGGIRRDVRYCVLCHTAGAEDRINLDPAKATPGRTINFRVMIHKIHRGSESPQVAATANGTDPYRYEVIGFGDRLHDYSTVKFPAMPGGTGFNQQTRNCEKCHGGALEADAWYMRPSRETCGSCHDDIDNSDGTHLDGSLAAVADGTLTRADLGDPLFRTVFHPPQADDSSCLGCHGDTAPEGVRKVHKPPLLVPATPTEPGTNDIQVEITGATGGTGPSGTFLPGDSPQVTFEITDGAGVAIDMGDVSSVRILMSGPTGNYQKIIPAAPSTTVNVTSLLAGTGPHTVTIGPIPATYPAQNNENKRVNNPAAYPAWTGGDPFTFEGGWGELLGRPLEAGTYTIAVYAYQTFASNGTSYRDTSLAATFDVLVSTATETATTIEPHADIIANENCNKCHNDLRFHGNTRRSVRLCVLCHTSGAEDRARASTATPEAPEPDTIDFRVMIHKIHKGEELTVVENGGVFDLGGFGSRILDFSHGVFPAMPGGARNCEKCHGTSTAWRDPTERDDYRIWMKVCTACHDSAATRAHVGINTLGAVTTGDPFTNAIESCRVCHGPGRDFAVDKVHKAR